MAASMSFPSSAISSQLLSAYSKPLAQRCRDIDDILRNSSHKDLHNALPGLLENIFGFGAEPGWGLDSITKSQHLADADAVLRLLGPEGPLLSLIYNLQTDPYLAFEFPFSCLPGPTRRMIEDGSLPMFYVNKVQYNQAYSKPALALSAFEFYMFHFCYTLVNPEWQNKMFNWNNIADIVYPCLLDDYLQYFLPLNKKDLPKFPHAQASPVRSSMVQQTPNMSCSGKHSPGSGTQPRTRSRLGLLKADLMSTQKSHSQGSPGADKAEAEIWWSDTFIQILAEFWFNQNSQDNEKGITPQTLDTFSTSNNHVRLVRLLVKHIHYFVNSAAPEIITSPYQTPDASPLDEFKRSLIPQTMQKKMYAFLRHSFDRWPLDSSFKLVLETWLTYIQPWRYVDSRAKTRTDVEEVTDSWFPFIRDNFLFYTALLQDFLLRVKRMHLTAVHNAYMLFRVSKVFSLKNLPQLLREVEKMMYNSSFKSSHQDLGGTYIVPEISMVLKFQMCELERSDFTYVNLFGSETQADVRHVLQQITDAKFAIESSQPEKKAAKSGFASFFDFSSMFEDSRGYGDLSGSEVKKLIGYLEQAISNLCHTFNLPQPSTVHPSSQGPGNQSLYAGDQSLYAGNQSSLMNQTFTISPPATPDCVRTEHGLQLTPLGRYQVMNGLRKFDIGYQGDPDLQPIRSFENKTLVRVLHRVSAFINKQFNQRIQALYNRQDIIGRMSHVYFAPPLSPSSMPQTPVSHDVYQQLQKPRISLRFLANYQTLLYLGIVYGLLWFGWGIGSVGYVMFLMICVLAYACFRALTEPQEFNVH